MEQKKIDAMLTSNLSTLIENLALMTAAMTRLIIKYEILIEDTSSFRATLQRIESKVDMVVESEEVDQS